MKKLVLGGLLATVVLGFIAMNSAPAEAQRGLGMTAPVFVTSQGLYYDTFVVVSELPPFGRFQFIENGVTEFGPGDRGYLGGRWMAPDGEGGFIYFLCPLLGPGRPNP